MGTINSYDLHGTNEVQLLTITGGAPVNEIQTLTLTAGAPAVNEIQTLTLTGGAAAINEVQTLTLTAGNAPVNEIQTLTLTAGAVNDDAYLTFNAHESTAPITFPAGGFANTTAAQVKACLLTISDWTALTADIAVVKTGNAYAITFTGTLGGVDIGAITVTNPTGTAAGSVAETTKGSTDTFKLTMLADEGDAVSVPVGGFAAVTLAQIKTAADSCVGIVEATNCIITGPTGGPFVFTFADDQAGTDVAAATVTSKTGASDGAFAETTKGVVANVLYLTRGTEGVTPVTMPAGGFANVTAAQVKTSLLSIVAWNGNTADIAVVKTGNDYAITFSAALGYTDIGAITVTNPTGTAAGSVAETTKGVIQSTFKLTMLADEGDAITMPVAGYTAVTLAQVKTAADSCVGVTEGTNTIITGPTGGPFVFTSAADLAATAVADYTVTSATGTAAGAFANTAVGKPAGTFTHTWGGDTSAATAYNASAATLQTNILAAGAALGTGDIAVTGAAGGPYTLTYTGAQDAANVAEHTANGTNCTATPSTVTGGGVLASQLISTSALWGYTLHENGAGNAVVKLRAGSATGTVIDHIPLTSGLVARREWPKALAMGLGLGCYVEIVSGDVDGTIFGE